MKARAAPQGAAFCCWGVYGPEPKPTLLSSFALSMKITGKRSFALSQLERYEFLTIAAALNDYYKLEMDDPEDFETLTPQGQVALAMLNRIHGHLKDLEVG